MTNGSNDPERDQGSLSDRIKSGYQTRLSNLVEYSFSGRLANSEKGFTGFYSYSGWIFALSIVIFLIALLFRGDQISSGATKAFWQLEALNLALLLLLRRRGFFIFSCLALLGAIVNLTL